MYPDEQPPVHHHPCHPRCITVHSPGGEEEGGQGPHGGQVAQVPEGEEEEGRGGARIEEQGDEMR
jgi:hypothetical protein